MSGEIVYLNGDYLPAAEAKVSVFDRGFLFGDSVYEVIPFYRGVGFRLPQHLARLERSLRALDIRVQQDWTAVLNGLVQRQWWGQSLRLSAGYPGQQRATQCRLRPSHGAHPLCLLQPDPRYLRRRAGGDPRVSRYLDGRSALAPL